MKLSILIFAAIVAAFRPVLLFIDFNQHVDASYQAIAHLFVGGLVGAWISWAPYRVTPLHIIDRLLLGFAASDEPWQIRVASALTIVEIVCATLKVFMKPFGD